MYPRRKVQAEPHWRGVKLRQLRELGVNTKVRAAGSVAQDEAVALQQRIEKSEKTCVARFNDGRGNIVRANHIKPGDLALRNVIA